MSPNTKNILIMAAKELVLGKADLMARDDELILS
jgi:hypothetical protein